MWSDEIYSLYGRQPGQFIPTFDECLSQTHPEDAPRIRETISRTLENGDLFQYECRIVRPDGVIRWKLCEGVLQRDAAGLPLRMWGTAQDITTQRQAAAARQALEDQLREAHRLESIGVLAAGIAHEFNNVLTAVVGHAELAELELPDNTPGRIHLPPIRHAAERAAELCRKMLAYSGKGRVIVRELDFNAIVREAVNRLGDGKNLTLALGAGPLPIRGDAEQLRQLAANLISNAIDTGCDTVRVSTRTVRVNSTTAANMRLTPGLPNGEYLLLEVSDDGPGMDEETQLRAFEPFFSTKFPGRGLGLAVVLGVVRTHSGGVELESTLGQGTTVRVYLPQS
jgi:signal transduction histidine kinase